MKRISNITILAAAFAVQCSQGAPLWTLGQYANGTSDTTDNLKSITYGDNQGIFVMVGNDATTSYSSANGTSWTQGGAGLGNATARLTGVTYANGRFVAVGQHGSTYTSSDGIDWTFRPGNSTNLSSVACSGDIFVAVGDAGHVVTTPALIAGAWTAVNSGVSQNLNAITFAALGTSADFVAVGDNSTIIINSHDGSGPWTTSSSGSITSNSLHGVAYGGGYYVTVGDAGTILTSPDGATWSQPNIYANTGYVPSTNALRAVAYGNGLFVAVGDNGWTAISSDATHWTVESSATLNNLNGIVYHEGAFIAVGDNGTIMESIPLIPLSVRVSQVRVCFHSRSNQIYEIQYRSDLTTNTWATLGSPFQGDGQIDCFFASTLEIPQRFFRVIYASTNSP